MVKVKITNGDVGPSLLPKHWDYHPYQKREYRDGLVMLLEWSTSSIDGKNRAPMKVRGTVWIKADGRMGGFHQRLINNPSDIGALYKGFRKGLIKLGLYGEHGIWDEDGYRLTINGEVKS